MNRLTRVIFVFASLNFSCASSREVIISKEALNDIGTSLAKALCVSGKESAVPVENEFIVGQLDLQVTVQCPGVIIEKRRTRRGNESIELVTKLHISTKLQNITTLLQIGSRYSLLKRSLTNNPETQGRMRIISLSDERPESELLKIQIVKGRISELTWIWSLD